MANNDHVKRLREGVDGWNKWRFQERDIEPDLAGADLRALNLRGAHLGRANAQGANFAKSDLKDAYLGSSDFARSDLSGARLISCRISHANFDEANLTDASMAYSHVYLTCYKCAVLTGAGFHQARVDSSDFEGSNLQGANLTGAHFLHGNFNDADLSKAHLNHCTFKEMSFARTELANATLGGTGFEGIDLSETRGLDLMDHHRSSYVDVDTLYKSRGKIPEVFLRSAGIPGSLLNYLPSLIASEEGLQFYSCFISHSHKDERFCRRLHSRMQEEQLRVYFAPEDMDGGKKIHEQIETQIQLYDKLLLVLSEHSMKSEWVATEIYQTEHLKKKDGRQILFPIAICPHEEIRKWKLFDGDSGKDLAREIRTYLIPDFSNWENEAAFESAFARLLKSLRANDKK